MTEKRAQVEHLLEVLGLQVRPSRPYARNCGKCIFIMQCRDSLAQLVGGFLMPCHRRGARTRISAMCCRGASAAGRRSAPTLVSR